MATCKDCIHYYVCNSKGANCREDINSGSKAKYIDVKELSIILDIMKNPDSEFATDDYIDGFSDGISAAIKELKAFPTADVAPVKHGCWEVSFLPRSYYGSDHDYEYTECECSVTCSNCHGIASCFPWKKQEDSTGFIKAYQKGMIKNAKTNYCPNCGAKMDGGD